MGPRAGRHILLLTDGPLPAEVSGWVEAGHRVTVITGGGGDQGAGAGGDDAVDHPRDRLDIHRVGRPLAARAALACRRGAGRDADVVVEVADRVAFLAPLWWWMDVPRVTLLHDLAEAPRTALRTAYRHCAFLTASDEVASGLAALGIPQGQVRADGAGAAVLDELAAAERSRLRDVLRRSQTGAAAGLAAASLVNNAIQLVFVIVFTRLLGADGYGALAAMISAFLILMVAAQAVQAAVARETALGALGVPGHVHATVASWTRRVLVAGAVLVAVGAVAQDPIAAALGVREHAWAAGAIPLTGAIWLLLSLRRGVLLGLHQYAPVGQSIVLEAGARIACGLVLVAAGLGVTGAYLGTPLAFVITAAFLGRHMRRLPPAPAGDPAPVRPLGALVSDNWVPILGLLFLAAIQNLDVIVARHVFEGDAAGSYAAASVAAKAVVWVAIGVGLQLLPEATRRAAAGLDPRPTLLRALALLAVIAAPALVIFAAVPHLLLKVAFGPDLAQASGALPILGVAMTVFAVAYLTVQYLVALGEPRFVPVIGVLALAEPFVLAAGHPTLTGFAAIVLAVQLVVAAGVLGLALRGRRVPALVPAAPRAGARR